MEPTVAQIAFVLVLSEAVLVIVIDARQPFDYDDEHAHEFVAGTGSTNLFNEALGHRTR